jgi:hypothetical protein
MLLCPMPSSATTRSLLVTPNSFARSMTFTRPATSPLPPPPVFHDLGCRLSRGLHDPLQRSPQSTGTERPVETLDRRARIRAAPRRHPTPIDFCPVTFPSQSHQIHL